MSLRQFTLRLERSLGKCPHARSPRTWFSSFPVREPESATAPWCSIALAGDRQNPTRPLVRASRQQGACRVPKDGSFPHPCQRRPEVLLLLCHPRQPGHLHPQVVQLLHQTVCTENLLPGEHSI